MQHQIIKYQIHRTKHHTTTNRNLSSLEPSGDASIASRWHTCCHSFTKPQGVTGTSPTPTDQSCLLMPPTMMAEIMFRFKLLFLGICIKFYTHAVCIFYTQSAVCILYWPISRLLMHTVDEQMCTSNIFFTTCITYIVYKVSLWGLRKHCVYQTMCCCDLTIDEI